MPSGWRGWRAGNHEHADGVPFRYAAGCSPGLKVRLVLPLLRTFAIGLSICLFPPLARAEGDTLVLGRISDDPKAHYEQLKPLLDYVVPRMKDVGISQGRILMARNDRQMASYLRSGRVDWVTETPASGVMLRARASAVPLLRSDRGGSAQYTSVIFVRKDSAVRNLADLRGRSIAFQSPASTSAYIVPAYEMLLKGLHFEVQITPSDRPDGTAVGYLFARTERNIATWVVKGLVDAGAVSDLDWRDPARMPASYRAQLRTLHVSAGFPRAMELVSAKMPARVRDRLQQVLVDARSDPAARKALAAFFGTTGFEPIDAHTRRELDYLESAVMRVSREVE